MDDRRKRIKSILIQTLQDSVGWNDFWDKVLEALPLEEAGASYNTSRGFPDSLSIENLYNFEREQFEFSEDNICPYLKDFDPLTGIFRVVLDCKDARIISRKRYSDVQSGLDPSEDKLICYLANSRQELENPRYKQDKIKVEGKSFFVKVNPKPADFVSTHPIDPNLVELRSEYITQANLKKVQKYIMEEILDIDNNLFPEMGFSCRTVLFDCAQHAIPVDFFKLYKDESGVLYRGNKSGVRRLKALTIYNENYESGLYQGKTYLALVPGYDSVVDDTWETETPNIIMAYDKGYIKLKDEVLTEVIATNLTYPEGELPQVSDQDVSYETTPYSDNPPTDFKNEIVLTNEPESEIEISNIEFFGDDSRLTLIRNRVLYSQSDLKTANVWGVALRHPEYVNGRFLHTLTDVREFLNALTLKYNPIHCQSQVSIVNTNVNSELQWEDQV